MYQRITYADISIVDNVRDSTRSNESITSTLPLDTLNTKLICKLEFAS